MAGVASIFRKIREMRQQVLYARDLAAGHIAMRHLAMRDARMFDLLQKGRATSEEIYYADFGTSNPNGLDITYERNEESVFRNLAESEKVKKLDEKEKEKFLSRWAGHAGDSEFINLNDRFVDPYFPNGNLSNIISHEHMHQRQYFESRTGWHSIFDGNEMQTVFSPQFTSGVAGHINKLTLQFNHAVKDHFRQAWLGILPVPVWTSTKVSSYLGRPAEIQARMQEIMAQGYSEWQKMPTNQLELKAAMHGAGVKAPLSVLRELYMSIEGRQALRDFQCSSYLRKQAFEAVYDINRVYSYAGTMTRKNMVWREAFPAIYGNMLELMGDRLGRERMGLGPSYRPAIEVLKALNDHESPLPDNMEAMLDQVPQECVKGLFNAIMRSDSAATHPQTGELIDAILERPAFREAIVYNDKADASKGIADQNPLCFAIGSKRLDIFRKLLAAGADPLQKVEFTAPDGLTKEEKRPVLMQIEAYENIKKILSADASVPRRIKKEFNDCEKREILRENIENMEAMSRILADYYPDIDTPRTLDIDDKEETFSLREILHRNGLETMAERTTRRKDEANPGGL